MSQNIFRSLVIIISGLLFTIPGFVLAGANSGFYLGGGVGDAAITVKGTDPTEGVYDFNESDFAYKIFAGYNIGYIPLIDFAVEGSYVDFGKPTSRFANGSPLNFQATGLNLFGLAGINFGPVGLFVKAGAINWQMESNIGATSTSTSGFDPAYGIGAKIQISAIAIRAEYEIFDISPVNDLSMVSASIVYTF